MILNPSEQITARVQAVETVASIICESSLRETTYSKRYEQTQSGMQQQKESRSAHVEYRSKIRDLYKEILTFQATNICFLSDKWAKRALKDFAKWDDWEKIVGALEEQNSSLRNLDTQWSELRKEEQWQEWQSGHRENARLLAAIEAETERVAAAITSAQQNSDRRSILDWLRLEGKSINPSKFLQEYAGARTSIESTGDWILEHPDFRAWKTGRNSFLWLQGKVGSGKSVLR